MESKQLSFVIINHVFYLMYNIVVCLVHALECVWYYYNSLHVSNNAY